MGRTCTVFSNVATPTETSLPSRKLSIAAACCVLPTHATPAGPTHRRRCDRHGIELIEVGNPTRTALIRRDGKEIRIEMKEGEQAVQAAFK